MPITQATLFPELVGSNSGVGTVEALAEIALSPPAL
jgi:hypothetical protein